MLFEAPELSLRSIQAAGRPLVAPMDELVKVGHSHMIATPPCSIVALIPLVDTVAMHQWTGDLDAADVKEILSAVPAETEQGMHLLHQAILQSDLAKARCAAHRLKGMAANLGAPRLANQAREIEVAANTIDDVAVRFDMLKTTVTETLLALTMI